MFNGWQAKLTPKDTEVVTIQRPNAGLQELTLVVMAAYKHCWEIDYCAAEADPDAIYCMQVDGRVGSTSPGSSGAGLFNQSQQLIGTLLGGSDEGAPGGFDDYGRFDAPYRADLQRWLGYKQ